MADARLRQTIEEQPSELPAAAPVRKRGGMTAEEAAYMRGDRAPVAGSIPMSTSKYLNSPLFVHAFSQKALRRMGDDVATTYDIPDMSRAIDDVTDYAEWAALVEAEKRINPDFAAWLEERRTTRYNPHAMGDYAAGTLGATIRDFMLSSGYDMEFIDKGMKPASDLEYLMKRAGECHDIHHMVSGFGPNIAGEHALIMMNVTANAHYFSPELAGYISRSQYYLSAANYMRCSLHYSAGMPRLLEATQLGIEAGRSLRRPLIVTNWENYLDWQIDDIATELGFTRGPGDAWQADDHLLRG